MRLVFVHGWAFDSALWDGIAAALPDLPQIRIELGFLGATTTRAEFSADDVLIGHSLGFLWGVTHYQTWRAAIAINGFARFAGGEGACVRPASLRAMRLGLARDAQAILDTFYCSLGCAVTAKSCSTQHLAEGLALLETRQIATPLAAPSLILAARNDPLVPVAASEHLAAVAGRPVTWSGEGGHLLPLTRPQWCADAIGAFLA